MTTSTIVGFAATVLALSVFLVVSFRQLARVRKVAAGEIRVGNGPDAPDDADAGGADADQQPGGPAPDGTDR